MAVDKLGYYIVIEGNDGTGKSTQIELLAEHFRELGREVCVVEEPGSDDLDKSTPVANELRRLIKNGNLARDPEINLGLFSAARHELWCKKIRPALGCGKVVLSSRNYLSTLAYQGRGEGVDEAEILRMTRIFTGERYMHPDAMIVLVLGDAARRERIAERDQLDNPDTFESREQTFQDRVNQAYTDIAKTYDIVTIEVDGLPAAGIHRKIIGHLE